eukprot:1188390-Prorocentrum_minimum.AAC.2
MCANTSVQVDGVGAVKLPLGEEQAHTLLQVCEQAPYEHNMDTVVNTAVRDAFQLDSKDIKLGDAWKEEVRDAPCYV